MQTTSLVAWSTPVYLRAMAIFRVKVILTSIIGSGCALYSAHLRAS